MENCPAPYARTDRALPDAGPYPRTKRRIIFYPRVYSIIVVAKLSSLKIALRDIVTKNDTKHEFLINYDPSLILEPMINCPNTYLVHLSNVSSLKTRQIFVNRLLELKKKHELTLQMAWITWFYPNLKVEEYQLQKKEINLSLVLLGSHANRASSIDHLSRKFPTMRMNQIETLPLYPAREESRVLLSRLAIYDIDRNERLRDIRIPREKRTLQLLTLYAGLSRNKSTWTEPVRILNEGDKNHPYGHSSSDNDLGREQQESRQTSPVPITVTAGTSRINQTKTENYQTSVVSQSVLEELRKRLASRMVELVRSSCTFLNFVK